MENSLCIAIEASDSTLHLTRTSIYHFIKTNPWFAGKIYLLTHSNLPFSVNNLISLKLIYENIEIFSVDAAPIINAAIQRLRIKQSTKDQLFDLLKMGALTLPDKKILYFSSTCIFLGDISAILTDSNLIDDIGSLFYINDRESINLNLALESKPYNSLTLLVSTILSANRIKLDFSYSHQIPDHKFNVSKNKILTSSAIIFTTIKNKSTSFSKINQAWLSKNTEAVNSLVDPRKINMEALIRQNPKQSNSFKTINNYKDYFQYSKKIIKNTNSRSKFLIVITTYNRSSCIVQLTERLKILDSTCKIIVVDDASINDFDIQYIDCYVKLLKNNGKKNWWNTVNILWSFASLYDSEYCIMLPDDCIPNDSFFIDALNLWNSINDSAKIALHLANNNRTKNWTNFNRIDYNDNLYLTQTTEFSFMCLPEFIKFVIPPISPKRWLKNPLLGSGVGSKLNNHWISKNKKIYGVKKSLISSNPNCKDSMMNYRERKINPWILK